MSTILYFILTLLLLVLVHEAGHFFAARFFKVKVLRFSFGFGKILYKFTSKKGTDFVFSLIPLGGYVKMLDEGEGSVLKEEKHLAFNNQSLFVRTMIVLAGPMANFLAAILSLWIMWMIGVKSVIPVEKAQPSNITSTIVHRQNPLKALQTSFYQTVIMTKMSFTLIGRIFIGQIPMKNLSGPIGIAKGAEQSFKSGVVYYLFFLAMLNVSLATINLLPIPLLDGGHLFFYFIEKIKGTPLSVKQKTNATYFGLIFLMALMIVAITNDLTRLIE